MNSLRFPLAVLMAGALVACDDDTTGPLSGTGLVGTWVMQAAEARSLSNPSETRDLIALGYTLTFRAFGNGRYVMVAAGGGESETIRGTCRIQGNTLLLTDDLEPGTTTVVEFTLSGDTLTVTWIDTFDFGNGEEPAEIEVDLVRTA